MTQPATAPVTILGNYQSPDVRLERAARAAFHASSAPGLWDDPETDRSRWRRIASAVLSVADSIPATP